MVNRLERNPEKVSEKLPGHSAHQMSVLIVSPAHHVAALVPAERVVIERIDVRRRHARLILTPLPPSCRIFGKVVMRITDSRRCVRSDVTHGCIGCLLRG